MSAVAELVSRLIAAGTPPELAAVVVTEAFAEGAEIRRQSADSALEKRRAYDRERMRKKREVVRQSADSADSPQEALTPKIKSKSVSRKHSLSADWKPNEAHYTAAEKLHIPRTAVDAKGEDMRIWAGSTGALKADWDLTFHGFLRRDAPKLAVVANNSTAKTTTPESPNWNPWKSHFRDTGQNFRAAQMDKCASDGKPFTVPTEWPPGFKTLGERSA